LVLMRNLMHPPYARGAPPAIVDTPLQRLVHMATKRKRLQVTLSDEVWALVDEVHALTGTPKSAVISEILDQVSPVFQNTIHALRIVQEQPREAQRLIQNFANEAIGKVAQASLELDQAIDGRTVKGKRARRSRAHGAT